MITVWYKSGSIVEKHNIFSFICCNTMTAHKLAINWLLLISSKWPNECRIHILTKYRSLKPHDSTMNLIFHHEPYLYHHKPFALIRRLALISVVGWESNNQSLNHWPFGTMPHHQIVWLFISTDTKIVCPLKREWIWLQWPTGNLAPMTIRSANSITSQSKKKLSSSLRYKEEGHKIHECLQFICKLVALLSFINRLDFMQLQTCP